MQRRTVGVEQQNLDGSGHMVHLCFVVMGTPAYDEDTRRLSVVDLKTPFVLLIFLQTF